MEIERIVSPDEFLLREDRDEYIAASCSSEWRNAAYRTATQEFILTLTERLIARWTER